VNLGKLDNPGGGNHGILGPHGKREQVLPSPHSLVFIPCIRCVPWLTTERIFYHGTLGPHGKREQVLPSPHALVFISVYSVCSVVDHRADFLPRNTRTTRKKRTGPSQSSCPGLHSVCSVCSVVAFFSSVGSRMSSLYVQSFDNSLNDCFGIMAKVDEKAK
jgi:hypothetical protein